MGRKTKAQQARAAKRKGSKATPLPGTKEPLVVPNRTPVVPQDVYRRAAEIGAYEFPSPHNLGRETAGSSGKGRPLTDDDPEVQEKLGDIQKGLKGFLEGLQDIKSGKGPKASKVQQEAVAKRLKALHDLLSTAPKSLLEQFYEIGLDYRFAMATLTGGSGQVEEIVVLRKADIERVDGLLANQGTLYQQLYRKAESE